MKHEKIITEKSNIILFLLFFLIFNIFFNGRAICKANSIDLYYDTIVLCDNKEYDSFPKSFNDSIIELIIAHPFCFKVLYHSYNQCGLSHMKVIQYVSQYCTVIVEWDIDNYSRNMLRNSKACIYSKKQNREENYSDSEYYITIDNRGFYRHEIYYKKLLISLSVMSPTYPTLLEYILNTSKIKIIKAMDNETYYERFYPKNKYDRILITD